MIIPVTPCHFGASPEGMKAGIQAIRSVRSTWSLPSIFSQEGVMVLSCYCGHTQREEKLLFGAD